MTPIQTHNSWIKIHKPNPQAAVRLFCFPYAGGSSLIFRTWSDRLPTTIEVCAIELPGRGAQIRLTPFTQMEPLVSAIAPILLPYLDKPFAFFGHSMGALVSFELTRLLQREYSTSPVHLFVSARRAPQVSKSNQPIHNLAEPEFLLELRRLNGTPQAVLENKELMELLIPTLRADFAVLETYAYTPKPLLNCPITVFGGSQDQEVSYDELQAWEEQTTSTFSLHILEGDHFFVNSAKSLLLQFLAQKLNLTLRKFK
jgi:medium-chain acyl-[acyl-carrier-protein] hydrolase